MDLPALPLAGSLAVLALIDSTSLGTLGLPVWMLARPQLRVRSVLVFLATIALFYWALGVALLAGLAALLPRLASLADSVALVWAQLALGVGLVLGSFLIDGSGAKRRRASRERSGRRSRLQRWQDRVSGTDPSTSAVVALGLGAGAVEAASMIPYLAALGLLATAGVPVIAAGGILGGYVLVMVAPALVLLAARIALARRVEPTLQRLSDWFAAHADSLLGWTVGIAGFLLASDAASRLPGLGG